MIKGSSPEHTCSGLTPPMSQNVPFADFTSVCPDLSMNADELRSVQFCSMPLVLCAYQQMEADSFVVTLTVRAVVE